MDIAHVPFQKNNGVYDFNDLFIYTSLKCNLRCTHCFVSSSPENNTLDTMLLSDIRPFFDEAQSLGVRDIYFTGGEPFVNKDIIPMIDEALRIAPVTVYTNATKPLEQKLNQLVEVQHKHTRNLLLRVSLDHYDPTIHDVFHNRGEGNFQHAVKTAVKAAHLGIPIAVTTQEDIHNNAPTKYIMQQFSDLFAREHVKLTDVKVLPSIPQGEQEQRTPITSFTPISSQENLPDNLMCRVGRTLIKYEGNVHVFPCTILIPPSKETISLFAKYEMGRTLKESLNKEQPLDHPSCRAYCVQGKQTCGNTSR